MDKTIQNLARLYINKCQDYVKYTILGEISYNKSFSVLQQYFNTFARQELTHSKILNELLQDITENSCESVEVPIIMKNINTNDLLTLINQEIIREKYNGFTKYKLYAKIAKDEGYKEIADVLLLLAECELSHYEALESLKKILIEDNSRFCVDCGVSLNKDKCPLCKKINL